MKKEVFLSIIIPMYNTGNYIGRCLDSLNNQINKNFEVILVDDGSKDNSFSVAKDYAKMVDFKCRLFKQHNLGVSKTRNLAMEKAEGKFLMFLDSDDYVAPYLVKNLIEKIDNNQVHCVYFGYDRVTEAGEVQWSYETSHMYTKDDVCGKDLLKDVINDKVSLSMSNLIFKRDIIEKNNIKFIEHFSNGEDQNFIFKALLFCEKIRSVDKILFHYVMRSSSVSHSVSIKNLTFIDALEDFSKVVKDDNELVDLILNKQMFENIKYNFHRISKVAKVNELMLFLNNEKIRKYANKYIKEIKYFNVKDRVYIYLLKHYPKVLATLLVLKEGKNK